MNKLSSTKVAEVLSQVPTALRTLHQENQVLREKVASYEKKDRVVKLASVMQAKNLDPETSFDDKVENLMGRQDLDVLEQAVELSAPQIKTAALADHSGNGSASAEDAFIAGLLDD